MPLVTVPPPYRGPTRGAGEIKVEGGTILECLDAVETRFPGFGPQVMDADGRMRRFVRLFLNGEPIGADALDTPVGPDDEVEILAAISGG
jgi:molybdopterin synthase sulfur carrier subunit